MILVEDSMWPVVAVGWVPDGGRELDEDRFWRSPALFDWLERRRDAIRERMCAFAWVIEDDGLRACTESWLCLTGGTAFTRCAAVFRTPQEGIVWLLERAPISRWS